MPQIPTYSRTPQAVLASQLNSSALSPISEERVGEAAGVTSATGSFGLSFALAFAGAIMLATLSIAFTNMAQASNVLPAAEQQHFADVLEDDARVMSDAQLKELLADRLAHRRGRVVCMMRLPDPEPSDVEQAVFG